MALNMTHKFTKSEVWPVGTGVAPGTAVLSTEDQPGVTITGSGDFTKTDVIGPYTISGIPAGGVGLADDDATVAVDGAFRFPVEGATDATAVNTPVYIAAGALTLTAEGGVLFGKIDRFIGETDAEEASVWIGA